jgi:DNA-binding NarL/FixJ family response regulator
MNEVDDHLIYTEAQRRVPRQMSVMLVEDHLLLRQGLKALLETDAGIRVVGEAGTVPDALAGIEQLKPSVVITDIALADQSGIDLIADLRKLKSNVPVLVLTVLHSIQRLRDAMQAGADGFVLKDSPHAELVEGLHAVCAGKRYFCEALSKGILSGLAVGKDSAGDRAPVHLITRREREVLTRIALGQSNKRAARDLGLSVKTIEKHRSNLMRKLNLHNTAAVTMFALRHGLVKREDAQAS